MNKNKYKLIGLFLLLASAILNAQQTVVLSSGEWLPFQSQNLKHGGVVAHIVSEAFKAKNIQIELKYYPWKRGYLLAKNASIDGTFVWSKKDERFADFLYSDTVITDLPVVFYRKDTPIPWEVENWESLKDIKVGATIGYTYQSNFKKYETEGLIQVERSETDLLNFKKLLRGRIGAFPASLNTGYGLLQSEFTQEEIDQLTYTPQMRPSYQPTTFHLLISKRTPDAENIVSAFNEGLAKLRKSGDYEKFLEQSRNGSYEISD